MRWSLHEARVPVVPAPQSLPRFLEGIHENHLPVRSFDSLERLVPERVGPIIMEQGSVSFMVVLNGK